MLPHRSGLFSVGIAAPTPSRRHAQRSLVVTGTSTRVSLASECPAGPASTMRCCVSESTSAASTPNGLSIQSFGCGCRSGTSCPKTSGLWLWQWAADISAAMLVIRSSLKTTPIRLDYLLPV